MNDGVCVSEWFYDRALSECPLQCTLAPLWKIFLAANEGEPKKTLPHDPKENPCEKQGSRGSPPVTAFCLCPNKNKRKVRHTTL